MSDESAFKAIADKTRRKILRLLRGGEMTAGALAERVGDTLTKPTLSHHFAVLKAADLISARREGQQIWYSLNTTVVQDLLTVLMNLFSGDGKERAS